MEKRCFLVFSKIIKSNNNTLHVLRDSSEILTRSYIFSVRYKGTFCIVFPML